MRGRPMNNRNYRRAILAAAMTALLCSVPADASFTPIPNPLSVVGYDNKVTSTPTVTASAYTSGNCIGGFNAVTFGRINGGGIQLNDVLVISKGGTATP